MNENLKKFEEICRNHNLKITPQRVAIYRALLESQEHPSAVTVHEKIKKQYPNVSLDTVNRTLLTFSEIGLLKIVEGRGDPKRFDINLNPHHHFRCIRCGKIEDFYFEEFDNLQIPGTLQNRYVVTSRRVHLEGICSECRE
ncbi:MAG: Fur family transcriptional regulator [Calditrichia bacterium]